MTDKAALFFGVGGYGDDIYNFRTYGTSRAETDNAKIDQIPSAYSLDNFGGVLYAMTSSDRRLPDVGPWQSAASLSS